MLKATLVPLPTPKVMWTSATTQAALTVMLQTGVSCNLATSAPTATTRLIPATTRPTTVQAGAGPEAASLGVADPGVAVPHMAGPGAEVPHTASLVAAVPGDAGPGSDKPSSRWSTPTPDRQVVLLKGYHCCS